MRLGRIASVAVALIIAALPAIASAKLYINLKDRLYISGNTAGKSCSFSGDKMVCDDNVGHLGNITINSLTAAKGCIVEIYNKNVNVFKHRWHVEIRGTGCKYHWDNDNTVNILPT